MNRKELIKLFPSMKDEEQCKDCNKWGDDCTCFDDDETTMGIDRYDY